MVKKTSPTPIACAIQLQQEYSAITFVRLSLTCFAMAMPYNQQKTLFKMVQNGFPNLKLVQNGFRFDVTILGFPHCIALNSINWMIDQSAISDE